MLHGFNFFFISWFPMQYGSFRQYTTFEIFKDQMLIRNIGPCDLIQLCCSCLISSFFLFLFGVFSYTYGHSLSRFFSFMATTFDANWSMLFLFYCFFVWIFLCVYILGNSVSLFSWQLHTMQYDLSRKYYAKN